MKRDDVPDYGIYLRSSIIEQPVLLRSRQSGDEINLPEGKKSLKKLFNEWQINSGDRWKIPVIQDRNGILGVLGAPWGGKNRFAEYKVKEKNGADECLFISWSLREF